MFRELCRAAQALPEEEVYAVLDRGTYGVLSLQGDDGYPYGVPLNYVREGGHLYFHCGLKGHKIDALASSDKASFCVVDAHDVVPEKMTTRYRSVIASGRASLVKDDSERARLIRLLCDKLAPNQEAAFQDEMRHFFKVLNIIDLHMEHVTGKEEKETAAARRGEKGWKRSG